MPCYDGGPPNHSIAQEALKRYKMLEAALCGITSALEQAGKLSEVLDKVDWKAAGVKRYQIEGWWDGHKAADEQRRQAEREAADRKSRIQAAKAKLTKEERELLGIK